MIRHRSSHSSHSSHHRPMRRNPDLSHVPDAAWAAQSMGLDPARARAAMRKAMQGSMRDATPEEIAELASNDYERNVLTGRSTLAGNELHIGGPVETWHFQQRLAVLKRAIAYGWTVEIAGYGKMPAIVRYVADYASQRPVGKRPRGETGDVVVSEGHGPWRVVSLRRPANSPMRAVQRRGVRRNPVRDMSDDHRIYVGRKASRHKGEWITPSVDADELLGQIEEVVGKGREWAIRAYENFVDMGEHPDLEQVAALANVYAGNTDADVDGVIALIATDPRYWARDVDAAVKHVENYYEGTHKSEKAFAKQLLDDLGMEGITNKEYYFDTERYGRDIRMDLDEEGEDAWAADLSDEELGQHYVDDLGWDGVGKDAQATYFDYDAFARDLFINDYVSHEHDGMLHVFRRG